MCVFCVAILLFFDRILPWFGGKSGGAGGVIYGFCGAFFILCSGRFFALCWLVGVIVLTFSEFALLWFLPFFAPIFGFFALLLTGKGTVFGGEMPLILCLWHPSDYPTACPKIGVYYAKRGGVAPRTHIYLCTLFIKLALPYCKKWQYFASFTNFAWLVKIFVLLYGR